jgi:hypothetical protein
MSKLKYVKGQILKKAAKFWHDSVITSVPKCLCAVKVLLLSSSRWSIITHHYSSSSDVSFVHSYSSPDAAWAWDWGWGSIVRRRGGTRWSTQRSPPLLLTMEDTAYSPYPPYDGGDSLFLALHPSSIMGKMWWNMMYIQSWVWEDGVRSVLLLSSSQWRMQRTPTILLMMEETAYSISPSHPSSIMSKMWWNMMYIQSWVWEEKWVAYSSSPPLLPAMEYVSYSSSLWWKIQAVYSIVGRRRGVLLLSSSWWRRQPTPGPQSALHHGQDVKEYDVYSIARRRGEVDGILLLLSSLQWGTHHAPRHRDGGYSLLARTAPPVLQSSSSPRGGARVTHTLFLNHGTA